MSGTRRLAALLGAVALLTAVPGTARAAEPTFSGTTAIGTHNAYEKAKTVRQMVGVVAQSGLNAAQARALSDHGVLDAQ
ncbi:hypothetical protein [Streptomyces sp. NPDC001275]